MSASTAPTPLESQRQGSRWLHAPPSEEQVRDWFATQPLHTDMNHNRYVGGIVVIGATEKLKVSFLNDNGTTFVREVEQAVFTPYVKVDTRIAYFWDLVRRLNGGDLEEETVQPLAREFYGDFAARIQPVPQRVIENEQSPYYNANLPVGMTVYPVRVSDQNVSRYLLATWEVTITHRESGAQVLKGQGSKQTAMKRQYPDDNAIMKVETGAVGRALGMAGVLVVGTGVATAEDMQEAMAPPANTAAPATGAGAAQLPAETAEEPITGESVQAEHLSAEIPDNEGDLRKMATELRQQMQAASPETWQAYMEWWGTRFEGQTLESLTGPALKGAVVKLQRDLDAVQRGLLRA